MAEQFLHGVELVEIDTGARPIQTVASSVIGICGTAPDSQPEVKASLATGVVGSNNALTWTAKLTGANGNNVSVALVDPKANSAALAVSVNGQAISVSLATGNTGAITTTATQLATAIAANAAANALVGVANTGASTGAGVVAAQATTALTGGIDEAFPLNTPVLIAGSQAQAALLGTSGTLPPALDSIFDQAGAVVIVVRVDVGADDTATTANVVGGVNSDGSYEGVHAFLSAESVTGSPPRILCAPGWTHQRTSNTANPVVAELLGIAERLRAVIIADGPNTNDTDAIAYRGDWGSDRVYIVDPWPLKTDSNGETFAQPGSACVAGLIAKTDNDSGFWYSPSNQEINGIIGTSRGVDFALGDPNCRANLLNASQVATIIRQSGYRLWGNRTTSSDPKWIFLSVRRTADIINDSLQRAHLWAVDRNITKTYVQEVQDSVNAYLRHLKAIGAIIDGKCWADPDLNTPDQIAQGIVYFNFDFGPCYPAEHIVFRSMLNNGYLTEIFSN